MQQIHPKSQLVENMLDLTKVQQKTNVLLMVPDDDFLKKGRIIKMQQGYSSKFGSYSAQWGA